MATDFPCRQLAPRRASQAAARCGATSLIIYLAGLLCLAGTGKAMADCAAFASLPPDTLDMGPRHHPIGRPLPASPTFNQPDGCNDGVWFFDGNGNRRPDADEPRLFGAERWVACASCHAESPAPKSSASDSVFLRQDASKLCLICHKL